MPYPNEHSCRLEDPGKFDRFARKNCEQKHDGKCIDVVYGIKDGDTRIQALRYPKDVWTASAARSHCKGRDGIFEAAGESDSKEDIMEERGAIGSHKTGTSDKAWDEGVNEKRLKLDQDAAFYSRFYAWRDPDGDQAKKSSYKFGHHEVDSGGNPGPANIRGCQSGIGVLNGARGGTTIPGADKKGVWNHLASHLRDADVEPAPLRSEDAEQNADKKYTCECIDCGHTLETDEHCRDIKCPECGGEMRRKERPGPGQKDSEPENLETRCFSIDEFRVLDDDEIPRIVGHPAVFNKESESMIFGKEKIAPGAFKNAIKDSDTRGLFNHDPNFVLGRKSAGTLKLKEDDEGLLMDLTPPQTQTIKDLVFIPMKRGDIKEGSFGFTVKKEEWTEDKEKKEITRTILEVDQLFDVSIVTFPAYPDTSVALRSLEQWRGDNKDPNTEPTGETPEGWEDITSADVDKGLDDLSNLDTELRKVEISKL